jgi:hypothetical protein
MATSVMIIEACAEILGLPQALLLPGYQESLFRAWRINSGHEECSTRDL